MKITSHIQLIEFKGYKDLINPLGNSKYFVENKGKSNSNTFEVA